MLKQWTSITQMLHLPSPCLLCGHYQRYQSSICKPCQALFNTIEFACIICAMPLPDDTFPYCGACCQKKPAIDKTTAPYYFEDPLRQVLHAFKYHQALFLSQKIAQLMLEKVPIDLNQTQCLIPVPLHQKRFCTRGYNQAALLARILAKSLRLPCELQLCQKITDTRPQASLNAVERQHNVKRAFVVKPTAYRHVTLVDDLITTGSTVNELATRLKQQGVEEVHVWCLARAVLS